MDNSREYTIPDSKGEILDAIRGLSPTAVTKIIREAVDDQSAALQGTWTATSMDVTSVGVGTIALIRCSGTASTATGAKPWSTIVKVVDPDGSNAFGQVDPDSSVRTEIRAYQQGIFAPHTPSFRGAKCHQVEDRGTGQYWLWIEDLSEYSGSDWSRAEYLLAARGIGEFKSAWLKRDVSQFDWLAPNSRVTDLEADGLLLSNQKNFLDLKNSDYFRAGVPAEMYARVLNLRTLMPEFSRAALTVPTTIAHNDFHIRNLFVSPQIDEVVAIDFARVGLAPLGLDGGELLGSSFMWTDSEAQTATRLADDIYENWLEGLKSDGWSGADETARFGFLYPMLRRSIMVPGMLAWVALDTEFPLRRYGGSRDEMPLSIKKRIEFILPLIDEATSLARQLDG